MQTILVRFRSNPTDQFSGVIAGYSTYRNGMFFFTVEHDIAIEAIYLKPFRASGSYYLIFVVDQK